MNDKAVQSVLRLPRLLLSGLLLAALLWAFNGQFLIHDPGGDSGSGIGGTGRLGGESGLGGTGGPYPGLGAIDTDEQEQLEAQQAPQALALANPAPRQLRSAVAVEHLRLSAAPAVMAAPPRRESPGALPPRLQDLSVATPLPVTGESRLPPAGGIMAPLPAELPLDDLDRVLAADLRRAAENGLRDSLAAARHLLLAEAFETLPPEELLQESEDKVRQRLLLPVRPERPDRPAISGRRPQVDRNIPKPPVRPMHL